MNQLSIASTYILYCFLPKGAFQEKSLFRIITSTLVLLTNHRYPFLGTEGEWEVRGAMLS